MSESRYRVLLVSSHVIQYGAPLFREMARHPKLDILVAYCSLQGAEKGFDPEFGIQVAWDIPLLDGYPWVHVPSRFTRPRLGSFFGLYNPGLWPLIRKGNFDAVVVYGYAYFSYWLAILATRFSDSSLVMTTDRHTLRPRDGKRWKVLLKKLLLPKIFGLADVVSAPTAGTVRLFRSLGVPPSRIFMSPFVVDNEYFKNAAAAVSRQDAREKWNIPPDARVVLFCAKLQPWKRPRDLLRAFAQAAIPEAYLVFAGEGPLRGALKAEAVSLGVVDRVRFLGFVNQSELPAVYVASDLFCLPSEHEPTGFVVDEVMVCGVPVVVSNQVGARFDLVDGRNTGVVYPVGDTGALASILKELLTDKERLQQMAGAARERMETWSFREHIEGLIESVAAAKAMRTSRQ